MYLSTITAQDASSKNKLYMKPNSTYLETSDIEGARPSLKGYQYMNKPSFAYSTEDIEKASPKRLHQRLEKTETNLQTRDIDGAFPNKTGFQTLRIGTNPLNPVYKLPQYEVYSPPAPKFIRDQISVHDIEGTKPDIYYKWATRNTMNIKDIEGSSPKTAAILSKPDLMDPKDINKGESKTYTRSTNPLHPEYKARDKDGNLITIGPVEGSTPALAVKTAQPAHKRHLDNSDIAGSGPDSKGLGPVAHKSRNYIKSLVSTADIVGAQAGSLPKGITTLRQTNPLNPTYTWQTEDKDAISAKAQIKEPQAPADPAYVKNTSKFYGASSPASATKSPPRSQSSSRVSSFRIDANRFYLEEGGNDVQKKEFDKNAEKFFDNKRKTQFAQFENVRNPGSINRPKPKFGTVDVESAGFRRDVNKFYLADQSRPQSLASGNSLASAGKEEGGRGQTNLSQGGESRQSNRYQFALSRAEIERPAVGEKGKSQGGEGNSRASGASKSQKSLFSAAAKHQLAAETRMDN